MDRVSTAGSYSSAILAINNAQDRIDTASQQANTGKVAQNLSGYGADAEKITAANSLQSRYKSYLASGSVLSSKLDLQDQALQSVATAANAAHKAIGSALAANDGSSLLTQLQSALSTAVTALNTQYNGQYVFAGSQTSTAPVAASTLTDLTASGPSTNVFTNDQLAPTSRLDDNTVVTSGYVASAVGGPLITALQSVQNYINANGPITGALTPAQSTFLTGVLASFSSANTTANGYAAQNGAIQQQLTASTDVLKKQTDTLTNTLSDLTDVNVAQAATNLQLAQFALQASAQVFSALKSSSLLNYLSATG